MFRSNTTQLFRCFVVPCTKHPIPTPSPKHSHDFAIWEATHQTSYFKVPNHKMISLSWGTKQQTSYDQVQHTNNILLFMGDCTPTITYLLCLQKAHLLCLNTGNLLSLQTRDMLCLQTSARHCGNRGGRFAAAPVRTMKCGCLGRLQISSLQTQQVRLL